MTFEPAEFLASSLAPATGVTDQAGNARPTQPGAPAVYLGAYKVRISKQNGGAEVVPEKYNVNTELGVELIIQDLSVKTDFTFALRS